MFSHALGFVLQVHARSGCLLLPLLPHSTEGTVVSRDVAFAPVDLAPPLPLTTLRPSKPLGRKVRSRDRVFDGL